MGLGLNFWGRTWCGDLKEAKCQGEVSDVWVLLSQSEEQEMVRENRTFVFSI